MPPGIAAFLCTMLIVWMLWIERRASAAVSWAIWIPTIWVGIVGSRMVSYWFKSGPIVDSPEAYLEGSSLDRNIFLLLIVAGILVVYKRGTSWSPIMMSNVWLGAFFAFAFLSFAWSDYPFVSLKRLIKSSGNLIMVMVVQSEARSFEAFISLTRKVAYILIPVSVLFIKYYPQFGRSYSIWTWEPFYQGVTVGKNALGMLCLFVGVSLTWAFLYGDAVLGREGQKAIRWADLICAVFIAWLLVKADSATSLVGMILATLILVSLKNDTIKRFFTQSNLVVPGILLLGLLFVFSTDVLQLFVGILGRDMTLTGRTELWKILLNEGTNPVIGVGFGSFWLGPRAQALWETYYWHPNQAHNGYLETYLNLGIIGLGLLLKTVHTSYRNITGKLKETPATAALLITYWFTVILHNFTEASFSRDISLIWFAFLYLAVASSGDYAAAGVYRQNSENRRYE